MESFEQKELFQDSEKKRAEKQFVSRDEALAEARWKLKNAEEALARFENGQNNSFMGSGYTQETLEKEVERWRVRVDGLESKK